MKDCRLHIGSPAGLLIISTWSCSLFIHAHAHTHWQASTQAHGHATRACAHTYPSHAIVTPDGCPFKALWHLIFCRHSNDGNMQSSAFHCVVRPNTRMSSHYLLSASPCPSITFHSSYSSLTLLTGRPTFLQNVIFCNVRSLKRIRDALSCIGISHRGTRDNDSFSSGLAPVLTLFNHTPAKLEPQALGIPPSLTFPSGLRSPRSAVDREATPPHTDQIQTHHKSCQHNGFPRDEGVAAYFLPST